MVRTDHTGLCRSTENLSPIFATSHCVTLDGTPLLSGFGLPKCKRKGWTRPVALQQHPRAGHTPVTESESLEMGPEQPSLCQTPPHPQTAGSISWIEPLDQEACREYLPPSGPCRPPPWAQPASAKASSPPPPQGLPDPQTPARPGDLVYCARFTSTGAAQLCSCLIAVANHGGGSWGGGLRPACSFLKFLFWACACPSAFPWPRGSGPRPRG